MNTPKSSLKRDHAGDRIGRRLVCGLLLASSFGVWTAAQAQADDSLKRLQRQGVVRVANTQASPPWSFLSKDNQPTGYDVAVAREVFKRIGIPKIEFIADKFKNFVEGINAKKYDVVVNSMARTAERVKVVDFTVPYAVQDFRIWVAEKNTDIRDIASLKGKSVGASAGTSNELWAREHLPNSEIKTYDNGGFVYNDLVSGRLDATIDSFFHGNSVKVTNKLPVKTVGEPLVYSLGAAVVPKNANELREAMDKALSAMLADGTLQAFSREFLGPEYDMVGNIQKAKQQAK